MVDANAADLPAPTEPEDPYMTYRANSKGDWLIWVYNYDESAEDGLTPWSHGASPVPDIAYVLDPQPEPDTVRLYLFRSHQNFAMRPHAVSTHRYPPSEDAPEHGPGCCTLRLLEDDPQWPDEDEDASPILERLEYGDIPEEAVTVVAAVSDAPVLRLPDPDAENDVDADDDAGDGDGAMRSTGR